MKLGRLSYGQALSLPIDTDPTQRIRGLRTLQPPAIFVRELSVILKDDVREIAVLKREA